MVKGFSGCEYWKIKTKDGIFVYFGLLSTALLYPYKKSSARYSTEEGLVRIVINA